MRSEQSAVPFVTAVAAALLVLGAGSFARAAEGADWTIGERLHPFLESGVLVGKEWMPLGGHSTSPVRFMVGAGLRVSVSPEDAGAPNLESLGVEYMGAFAKDARQAVGPSITWRLSESWRLRDMVGPAWSNKADHFDRGWQIRNDLSYRNLVSFETVYQRLPLDASMRFWGDDVSSFYTGVALQGEPGAYFVAGLAVGGAIGAAVLAMLGLI